MDLEFFDANAFIGFPAKYIYKPVSTIDELMGERKRTTVHTFPVCNRCSIMYPNLGGHYGKPRATGKVA